jgi:hypothetical protein
MRNNLLKISLGLVLVLVTFSACAVPPPLPEGEGQALYDYILKTDYQNWDLWPGKQALRPSTHPHGKFITTYVNKPALKAIHKKTDPLPDGSIVIAENFSPDKTLAVISVMYKKAGYNPQGGDWFWAEYGVDGKTRREGKEFYCFSCHQRQKQQDFLFSGISD